MTLAVGSGAVAFSGQAASIGRAGARDVSLQWVAKRTGFPRVAPPRARSRPSGPPVRREAAPISAHRRTRHDADDFGATSCKHS
jgi:hypothetical protein